MDYNELIKDTKVIGNLVYDANGRCIGHTDDPGPKGDEMPMSRCPACGSKSEHGHLRNCKLFAKKGPTPKMLDLLEDLCSQLGEEFNSDISFEECQATIDEYLKRKDEELE